MAKYNMWQAIWLKEGGNTLPKKGTDDREKFEFLGRLPDNATKIVVTFVETGEQMSYKLISSYKGGNMSSNSIDASGLYANLLFWVRRGNNIDVYGR